MDDFEKLCKIIREHLRDELKIHRDLADGKRTLQQHYADTIRIHKKALREIQKLSR